MYKSKKQNLEVDPYVYGQPTVEKSTKEFKGKRTVFSTNYVGITRYPYRRTLIHTLYYI